MPVDVTRVKGELRKLFPKVNLTNKRLDEISARLAKKAADDADDEAITQLINDANDYYPFAEVAKDDDRFQTLKKKGKKSDEKKVQDQNPPTPDEDDDNDEPAWLSKMTSKFDSVLKELDQLKQEKVITSKMEEARKLFSTNEIFKNMDTDVQDHYLKQINFKDDSEPIEEQVTGLENIVKKIVQHKADSTEFPGRTPAGTGASDKMSETEMDAIIKNARA